MACITLFAPPLTMATTQLARVAHCEVVHSENASTLPPESNMNSLRMNWVVVTGSDGHSHLRMRWASDC